MDHCGPFVLIVSCQAWLPGVLCDRLMPDMIINTNHMIHYLKYAPTHYLLTK
jgi:hypothetical protein